MIFKLNFLTKALYLRCGFRQERCGSAGELCGFHQERCGSAGEGCGFHQKRCGSARELCGFHQERCGSARELCGFRQERCWRHPQHRFLPVLLGWCIIWCEPQKLKCVFYNIFNILGYNMK